MSKKNYNKISTEKKMAQEAIVEEVEVKEEPVVEEVPVEEAPKALVGIVTNCTKLNVRKKPSLDADILTTIPVHTEVAIDTKKSVDEWAYIKAESGVKGFCMKKYISAP